MSETSDRVERVSSRLMAPTERGFYDPYRVVDWPQTVGIAAPCLPDGLISIVDTETFAALDTPDRRRLALFECTNLFSVLLHGERAYVAGLAQRIHEPATAPYATYLHALIDEENKHMFLFSRFCTHYAGKVYPDQGLPFPTDRSGAETDLLFYAQALLMEELFDHLNKEVVKDRGVDATVRRINQIHIDDEARHIAFGRAQIADLVARLREEVEDRRCTELGAYLQRYMTVMLERLANPRVYEDAGLSNPYELRRQALASDTVRALHRDATASSRTLLASLDLLPDMDSPTGESEA